jgi:IS605 OrfB family transposase
MKITRTEKWTLRPSAADRQALCETVTLYQRYVRALSSVCRVHWPTLGVLNGNAVIRVVEGLVHPTAKRPSVRYGFFHRVFYKFPSYLRRSAIMDAMGQVRSFLSRYDTWQTATHRRHKHERPPMFGVSNSFPSLYKGQCVKYAEDLSFAEIKVYKDCDWVWIKVPIKQIGRRAGDVNQKRVSPLLVVTNKQTALAVPFEQAVTLKPKHAEVVCAVDLGINTSITASVVRSDGTVLGRQFIRRPRDIDRLHKRLSMIRTAAKKTKRVSRGFAARWYRKGYNIARNSAHQMTRALVEFARSLGATTLVFEHLKGWRPKGPSRGLRKRFHTWLHRRIVEFTEWKWREYAGRMAFVAARGTSKYAFDGSGEVTRSVNGNYSVCRFKNGKVYNCDLNATYNIAAKFFLRGREAEQLAPGQSPGPKPRIPVTLSLLWTAPAVQSAA